MQNIRANYRQVLVLHYKQIDGLLKSDSEWTNRQSIDKPASLSVSEETKSIPTLFARPCQQRTTIEYGKTALFA